MAMSRTIQSCISPAGQQPAMTQRAKVRDRRNHKAYASKANRDMLRRRHTCFGVEYALNRRAMLRHDWRARGQNTRPTGNGREDRTRSRPRTKSKSTSKPCWGHLTQLRQAHARGRLLATNATNVSESGTSRSKKLMAGASRTCKATL